MMHAPLSSPCVWITPTKMGSSDSEWFTNYNQAYTLAKYAMGLFLDYLQNWALERFLFYQELAQETRSHLGSLLASAVNTQLDTQLQSSFESFLNNLEPLATPNGWTMSLNSASLPYYSEELTRFRSCIVTLFSNFTYIRIIIESQ